ncbi:hypothetical protein CH260_08450 [Rhodococcus sp. 05-2256-B2]|nr:hypothetical protein CH258_27205 [Rhodococcus sp. 05-2256-B4]OZD88371.1 hypothetical protein CH257_23000 [Rhodococcus sp. 05-2256-B3]OZD98504.1 hypothetical protein CH260_08450 [Rhodococcus sp. 05-2256-B2]OZE05289.1 hypothetical protein CH285_06275 [Rhodococcus sp. 05-2256-B1]
MQRLEDLAHQYKNFSVVALNKVLPSALIFDDIWISSNFEWLLVPGGADRVFRAEEGTLVRHKDSVSKTYETYTETVKAAR